MNVDTAIKKRHSCRKYASKQLTDFQLSEILNAARLAPSPKNRQPWRFLTLRKEHKKEFLEMISESFHANLAPTLQEQKLAEFNSEKETYRIMEEADSIILVFNIFPSENVLEKKDALFDCANLQAIGAAIQNMLLKATELGISSLWICDVFTCYQMICNKYFKDGQLVAAVALGYSAEKNIKLALRKPLQDLLIRPSVSSLSNLIWVGPRESDIYDCADLFQNSVTIFGSNCNGNISYCAEKHIRIDHNVPEHIDDIFWENQIQFFKEKNPDAQILYYNSEFSYKLPENLRKYAICCNSLSTLKMLKDKAAMRMSFSKLVSVIPFLNLTYDRNLDLSRLFTDVPKTKLIFQESISSGGIGTHIVDVNEKNMELFEGKMFMVSPYFEKSIPVNVHLIIGEKDILYFPGSIQIIKEIDKKLIYLGADYIAFQTLSADHKNELRRYANILGKYLQKIGYKGIVGFDFIITKEKIMFVEVNARFQASTPLINKVLKVNGLPSIQEMHIMSFFNNEELPEQSILDELSIPYSMISYIEGTWEKPLSLLKDAQKTKEIDMILEDGFSIQDEIQKNAYLFKLIFNTNCVSVNADYCINIYENLLDIRDDFTYAIKNKEKLEIKISLLNQGVLITDSAKQHINKLGKIKDAVFSSVDLTIFDSLHINCPKSLKFSSFTPWKIDIDNVSDQLMLFFHNVAISEVTLDLEDIYGNNLIRPDIKFSDVCFWATDRIRIHHTLSCHYKNKGVGCKFCEVMPDKRSISVEDILYVVDFYLKHADSFRHFLIGGGSEPRETEYKNILKIVTHIRQRSSKDIYVMSLPPKDLSILKEYYEAGVTEIGFNIEIFDCTNAKNYMPAKGNILRSEYLTALKEAVKYWGNNGKVRSLMIVGLESEETLEQGIRELCQIGAMPILSVFRPIPGTITENIVPPSNCFLRKLYDKGTAICNQYSLHLGPECPSCQNNTLSLPFYIEG